MRALIATVPGRPGRDNEDFAAIAPGAAVLLDGAGSPAGMESGCMHSVAWYARTLGGLFLSAIVNPAVTLAQALEASIEEVNAQHRDTCDLSNPHSPSATASATRVLGDQLEYLVLSDSFVVLERRDQDPLVVTDDRVNRAYDRPPPRERPALGTDEHTADLYRHVSNLGDYRNKPGGFWVASTTPTAARQALTGSLPLDDVTTVALLSDGASRIVDRFGLLTWPDALGILSKDGPEELIRRTREAEAGDFHGARWPRGKASDDATVVYWLPST